MNDFEQKIEYLKELRKEMDQVISETKAEGIQRIQELIKMFDLHESDFVFHCRESKVHLTCKYRGPKGETWSGRGKTPQWLATLEANGHNRETFRL